MVIFGLWRLSTSTTKHGSRPHRSARYQAGSTAALGTFFFLSHEDNPEGQSCGGVALRSPYLWALGAPGPAACSLSLAPSLPLPGLQG